jgi:hypothetical protein
VRPRAPRTASASELDDAAGDALANAIDAARDGRKRPAVADAPAALGTPRSSNRRVLSRIAATMRIDPPTTAPSPVKTAAGWRNQ